MTTREELEEKVKTDTRYKKFEDGYIFTPSEEDIREGRNVICIPDERGLKERDPVILNDNWVKAFPVFVEEKK